jgi:endonuclease YncB( thermonuclease family)
MQRPPEHSENDPPEVHDDDLVNKVYGPSQSDIERSWDGYNTGGGTQKLGGMIWKVTIVVVSTVILGSLVIGLVGPLFGNSRSSPPVAPERISASVLRVIDGRTIVVDAGQGEQVVRLIGVELQPFGDPFYDFSQEVTQSWIDDKPVLLEADERDGDEQGRSLRYVYFGDIMINAALILNGLARVETEHPNVRYDAYLAEMERQARESEVGIWDPTFGNETEAADTQAAIQDSTVLSAAES